MAVVSRGKNYKNLKINFLSKQSLYLPFEIYDEHSNPNDIDILR